MTSRAALPVLAFRLALALALAAAGPAAADRPLLPDPPLGTGSEAFLGGGSGHAGGVNALFVNPGALSIPAGREIELGAMELSGDISPYTLFGGRAGAWSFAAGSFHDRRAGPFRSGLAVGGAREVVPGLSLGTAVRSLGGMRGFGADADAGLLLRLAGHGPAEGRSSFGLAVRNLAESGLGQEPEGYRTLRSYAVSVGAGREAARFPRLAIREPDFAYEFRGRGLRIAGHFHVFSAGAAFGSSGALSLRASMRLPHEGSARTALGGSYRFLLGTGSLGCGYVFSAGGAGTPDAGQAHALSLNLALGTRADRQPPWVAVRADRVYLGADAPGHDRVHFRLRAADRSATRPWAGGGGSFVTGPEGAEEAKAPGEADAGGRGELDGWTLAIFATDALGHKRRPVRIFQGKDLPPRLIRWDGRGDGGAALGPGYYAFRFSATDKAGNRSETAWQLVELGSAEPGEPAAGAVPPEAPAGAGSAGEDGHAPAGAAKTPTGAEDAPTRTRQGIAPPIVEGEDG